MKTEAIFKKTILAASIAMLAACGGGSGGGTPASDTTSVGVITGFGSTVSNCTKYGTAGATFVKDGESVTEEAMRVGYIVVIKGTDDGVCTTGTANSVVATDELEGYVFALPVVNADGTGTVDVMGQTVQVTKDTVFSSDIASLSALLVDDIVEIHGFSDGLGTIKATRIERKLATDALDIQVKGLVQDLNDPLVGGVDTFTIGGLTIDFAGVAVPDNLANGLYVEVKKDDLVAITGSTMKASIVEIEEDGSMDIDGDENDEIKAQGMLTNVLTDPVTGVETFTFSGRDYRFDAIETEGDFLFSQLHDGKIVTVEGTIDANGDFILKEIELITETAFEETGLVKAKTETSVTLDIGGGTEMTFTVNSDTRMIDERDGIQRFSLVNVQPDVDTVKVGYYLAPFTNAEIATELKRE